MPDITLLENLPAGPYMVGFLVGGAIIFIVTSIVSRGIGDGDGILPFMMVLFLAFFFLTSYGVNSSAKTREWRDNVYEPWVKSIPYETSPLVTVKGMRGIVLPGGKFYPIEEYIISSADVYVSTEKTNMIEYKIIPELEGLDGNGYMNPGIHTEEHVIVSKLYTTSK